MAPVLELRSVVAKRGADFRVDIAELAVARGEAVAIVGPSGSGKSTVLDVLACTLAPVEAAQFMCSARGEALDLGAIWRRDDTDALRRYRARMVGYVLQTGGLVPFLSLGDNVSLPFWRDGKANGAAVQQVLAELGITALASRMPRHVSVGQRQRAAIARALVGDPPILLADEPTASLDADTAETVMALLVAAARGRGAALVMVTHDPALARRHGLRIATCGAAGPGLSRLASAEVAA